MTDPQTPSKTRIRPAGPADIHRLVRLLPKGSGLPVHTRYLVAEDDRSGALLGGAYLTVQPDPRGGKVAAFQLAASDSERAGETTPLLLRACIVQARASAARALAFDGMITEGQPVETLLKAHAFTPAQILTEYVMDGQAMLKACNSAYRWIERKGGIPADARVIPLAEAPAASVQQLIHRYLGGMPALNWQNPNSNVLGDISTAVMVGPRVVAAIVVRDMDGEAESPYDVVEEEYRHGWVTIAMWRRAGLKGLVAGYDKVRFATNEENFRSFANFARRMRATPLGRKIRYRLPLQS